MGTPYESGRLILQLFDLRREAVLRDARDWFLRSFHPDSVDDVVEVLGGPHNPKYRMVTGYWEMAASLVTYGAIDRQMFLDANSEIFGTFAKVYPLLEDLRRLVGDPSYLRHLEEVVLSAHSSEERLEKVRLELRSLAESPEGSAPGESA